MGVPTVLRITRLVSKPGQGPALVACCAAIADRERALHPGEFLVFQGRRLLDRDRFQLVSITQWENLDLIRDVMPTEPPTQPPFHDEYVAYLESWRVDLYEATWMPETGTIT